jgi:Tol biopolymer transport system component
MMLSLFLMILHPVHAAFPGFNGNIAFHSTRDGDFEIFVMDSGGESLGITQLTSNTANDGDPAWSANGTKMVFHSNRDGNFEIYVMNADGSDQTRLTINSAEDMFPCWSPDGDKIAFRSNRDGNYEIYVMNADGSGQTRLTDNPAFDAHAAWSPDGSEIAFYSDRDGDNEIFVMDSGGESLGITQLTFNTANDVDPDWSPDGGRMAFHSNKDDPANYEIYVMNSDGSNLQRLTNNPADDRNAAWSPDGENMTFASDRDGNFEIFVMDADGESHGLTKLTSTTGVENYGPNWQVGTASVAIEKTEDIKSIVADTSEIPVSDFDGATYKVKNNRRNTLLNMLDEVVTDIEAAMASTDPTIQKAAYQNATDQLNSILDKTDGCSERGTPDTKGSGYTPDWITMCASQAKIDPLIRELLTMVQTLLAQIP